MIEIYSIDGNIGSGKSTLVDILKKGIPSNEYIDFIFLYFLCFYKIMPMRWEAQWCEVDTEIVGNHRRA